MGPRVGLDGEKSRPTGIRSLDRPARSQLLYRLSYPAHNLYVKYFSIEKYDMKFYSLSSGSVWGSLVVSFERVRIFP